METITAAEIVFLEILPGQFLTACLAKTWIIVMSTVFKWSQCYKVPQVENQVAKMELRKLKYYMAGSCWRDSQGSHNSAKFPARRGGRFLNYPTMYNEICCKSDMQN